jgi:hypothetical protein
MQAVEILTGNELIRHFLNQTVVTDGEHLIEKIFEDVATNMQTKCRYIYSLL